MRWNRFSGWAVAVGATLACGLVAAACGGQDDGPKPPAQDAGTGGGQDPIADAGPDPIPDAGPDPIPDAIEIPAEAGLVVTEGNYLLLDERRWHAARRECDAIWHLVTNEETRIERLVQRHHDSGKPPGQAHEWVARVDQPNADLVESAADRADVILDLSDWRGQVRLSRPGAGSGS